MIKVPNGDVLRAGIEHAELDLNAWNQAFWINTHNACGTTACLAGHILLAQGMEVKLLSTYSIPKLALQALGFSGDYCDHIEDTPDCMWCHDPGTLFYKKIFGLIAEEIDNFSNDPDLDMDTYRSAKRLKTEPAQFKWFKGRITELTGVEL